MEGSEEPSEMKIEADKAAEVPDGGVGESLVTHDESTVENGEMSNGLTTTEENDSNGPAQIYEVKEERRKSTRVKKEPTPLILEIAQQKEIAMAEKPKSSSHAAKFRFFRQPKRVYKPSALVDREWTILEREKLLDAVSKVAADDYASIADIIGNTRTPAEVKDYLKRIQIRAKEIDSRRYSNLFDAKRTPHSRHLLVKEDGDAIERWLRVIDHLVSDNDTPDFSKAIPDVFAVIANLEQNPDPGTIKGKPKKAAASSESTGASQEEDDDDDEDDNEGEDAVAPINYKLIYEYLYALLRGINPPALDPIEAWIILDLISDTATQLKGSDLEGQKNYLRCIYRDYCNKTFNMKWKSTTRMFVPALEEIVVKAKRRKMEENFAGYLRKKPAADAASTGGESEETERFDGYEPEAPAAAAAAGTANNLGASDPTSRFVNGHAVTLNGGASAEAEPGINPQYHNIMIGGLSVTKDAQDFGSLFTLNPLGVPVSLLNPKKQEKQN